MSGQVGSPWKKSRAGKHACCRRCCCRCCWYGTWGADMSGFRSKAAGSTRSGLLKWRMKRCLMPFSSCASSCWAVLRPLRERSAPACRVRTRVTGCMHPVNSLMRRSRVDGRSPSAQRWSVKTCAHMQTLMCPVTPGSQADCP